MQTTLVESPVRASEIRMEASRFSSRSDLSDMAPKRDFGFQSRNSFAEPENNNRAVIAAMVNSKIYQEYEKAFGEATGMPVSLRPAESSQWPAATRNEMAVPVHLGNRLIGFLETADGWHMDSAKADEILFGSDSARQHESVVKLLGIFAQHLSMLSQQVVPRQENSEPPAIARAKAYIHEHQGEDLSLGQVARAVNTSTFYFCKLFKKATGINFTDYVSRVRIEKARNLLLNPNLRVSEIAFEVGFQSLTHFNRVFKKLLGQSPTEYRAQVTGN
jgi:AraC-like DNA-binding protein